jgi:hypothetical protein
VAVAGDVSALPLVVGVSPKMPLPSSCSPFPVAISVLPPKVRGGMASDPFCPAVALCKSQSALNITNNEKINLPNSSQLFNFVFYIFLLLFIVVRLSHGSLAFLSKSVGSPAPPLSLAPASVGGVVWLPLVDPVAGDGGDSPSGPPAWGLPNLCCQVAEISA